MSNENLMNGNSKELLEALINEQTSRNLRDHQMAKLLGIGRSTWTLTKSGIQPIPRIKIHAGILNSFPKLTELLRKYQKSLVSSD